MATDPFTNRKKIYLKLLWDKIPKHLQTTVVLVCIFFTFLSASLNFFNSARPLLSNKVNQPTGNNLQSPFVEPRPQVLDDISCYVDWTSFSDTLWEGLRSRYNLVNGVYMLSGIGDGLSSVATFIRPCKGNVVARLEFISFANELINLDLYYGNQFRWEIGGNDLRSVKLYKNGTCTPSWYAREVETEFKYLPKGVKITPAQPVTTSMFVFQTTGGKLRTELHLKFIPLGSNETQEFNDLFYYEFEVGQECDLETAKNIDLDYERLGLELVRPSYNYSELPRVKFNRFQVVPYLPNNKL